MSRRPDRQPIPRPAPPPASVDPVTRFLGADTADGGPRGLLGLSRETALGQAEIEIALDAQLRRIEESPGRLTPAADEVRMALFAAAAQLLSGEPEPEPVTSAAAPRTAPTRISEPRQSPAELAWLGPAVRASVASSGGWNRTAMRRLASIAISRGVDPSLLAAMLSVSGQAHGTDVLEQPEQPAPEEVTRPSAAATATEPKTEPRPVNTAPVERDSSGAIILGLVLGGVLLISVMGGVGAWIISSTSKPAAPAVAAVEPDPDVDDEVVTDAGATPVDEVDAAAEMDIAPRSPARDLMQAEAMQAELAAAVRGLEFGPEEAIARFEAAINALGQLWVTLSIDDRRRASASVVSFVYRASSTPKLALRAIDLVGRASSRWVSSSPEVTDDAVRAGVWSGGMIARLAQERDLPATLVTAIDTAASVDSSGRGASFETGALAAARRMPSVMASRGANATAWEAWVNALGSAVGSSEDVRLGVLQRAAETLMLVREPRPGSRAEGLGVVIARMDWRAENTRRWVLTVLASPVFDGEAVRELTGAIVHRSSAAGVDTTFVFNRVGDERRRRALRGRFAELWGIEADRERLEVVTGLSSVLDSIKPGEDSVEALANAVIAARGSAAAAMAWRGRESDALLTIELARDPVDAVLAEGRRRASGPVPSGAVGNASWGERYLGAARNVAAREDLLFELSRRRGVVSTVDAEVLMSEALFGTPATIRARASQLIEERAEQTSVVNAALELLPRAPTTPEVSETLARVAGVDPLSLPDHRDRAWRAEVRRVLVERLIELLAAGGPYGAVDPLADMLADAYARASGVGMSTGASADDAISTDLTRLAVAVRRRWTDASAVVPGVVPARLEADRIEGRRFGRAELARGLAQEFAVEQLALFETALAVLHAEVPVAVDKLEEIERAVSTRRRSATHVLEQISVVEVGILRLWIVRLEALSG
ncbi:MAG: hypothetical protein AAGI17_04470 [Planctomycetota bacterium]